MLDPTKHQDWEIAEEMGVANYGQMTAGGWMYIGPQGIVHGTYNTLLNAGRMHLGIPQDGDLAGKMFISSATLQPLSVLLKRVVFIKWWPWRLETFSIPILPLPKVPKRG